MMKKLIESSRVNKNLVTDLDTNILEIALATFLKNASSEIEILFKSLNDKNFTQVKSIAHKLAGSSIVVGLEDFSIKAKGIELTPENEISQKQLKSLQKEFLLIQELAK